MRIAAALISVLCAGVSSQALATEPQPQSSSPAQVAATPSAKQESPAPASQPGPTAPAAQPSAVPPTADSTSIKPPITVTGAKPELTPDDKELIARGYKLEMRHGEKYFCRREQQIGSRFEVKSCDTAQSIQAHRADAQEALRVIQNDRPKVNN